jgi:hypothetical protein
LLRKVKRVANAAYLTKEQSLEAKEDDLHMPLKLN